MIGLLKNPYVIMAVISVIGSAFVVGYIKGRSDLKASIATQALNKQVESISKSNEVKKEIQSLDEIKLNRYLCELGSVRNNNGC